jgi:alpha-1,3/alpha-1,6-mannosyltransferase
VEVLFLLSVPNALKEALLRSANLLVYTPSNEHFGIVPLEAMLAGVPVLAANNGGPTETVVEHTTGWLRDPAKAEEWTAVMDTVLHGLGSADRKLMAERGMARVKAQFAVDQMARTLGEIFREMDRKPRTKSQSAIVLGFGLGLAACTVVALFLARLLLLTVWTGK